MCHTLHPNAPCPKRSQPDFDEWVAMEDLSLLPSKCRVRPVLNEAEKSTQEERIPIVDKEVTATAGPLSRLSSCSAAEIMLRRSDDFGAHMQRAVEIIKSGN